MHPRLSGGWTDHVYSWGRRYFDGKGGVRDERDPNPKGTARHDEVEGEEDEEEEDERSEEGEDPDGRGSNQDGAPSTKDHGDSPFETRIDDLLRENHLTALHHPYALVPATYYPRVSTQTASPSQQLRRAQPTADHPSTSTANSPEEEAFRHSMISYGSLNFMVLDGDYGERRQSLARLALSPLLHDSGTRNKQLLDRSRYEIALQVLCEEEAEKAGMSPEEWKAENAQE
ncbi:hypothetical protein LTR70_008812 [Exophiala xenobiotica]|uniref:Uncharacterized protein n=1 Tax=Lithohypha guttulata TaxID=1690604 RepID=A0ABR0JYE6_9EURO|nr:hypothetical protein LTR24_008978 [Lithohypha guttulata]KAK5311390.1 hypothetical protein LTR70_008812 [Exophiala xenobiotica]